MKVFMTTQAKQKLAVAVAAALAVGVLVYLAMPGLFGKRTQQNTNDAFVSADYTLVVPRVAGFIKEVLVEDNQRVKAGQLLALIDDRDLRASAEAADAQTLVARAQLQNAKATLERQTSVIAQAQASVVSAKAEMAFAQQELNRYNHLAALCRTRNRRARASIKRRHTSTPPPRNWRRSASKSTSSPRSVMPQKAA
jgi:membrane fusion protein (multidrug efflux system)